METMYKVISWTLVFILVSLLPQTLAKHVATPLASNYSCQCQVQVYDTSADSYKKSNKLDFTQQHKKKMLAEYDFGQIATYPADHSHDCHRTREMCRNICQDRAALNHRIKRQADDDQPPSNHEILGYHLCYLGQTITRDRLWPFRVDVQASVAQCPGKKAIKQRHAHLCCVITPLHWAGKLFNVLAWDEFCDAASKLHV